MSSMPNVNKGGNVPAGSSDPPTYNPVTQPAVGAGGSNQADNGDDGGFYSGFAGPQAPITRQPGGADSADNRNRIPANITNSQGLEYLRTVDQLLVKQKINRVFRSYRSCKYEIQNARGQNVFYAEEEDCSHGRNSSVFDCMLGFDMEIFDYSHNEVMSLNRPFSCCRPSMKVTAPSGNVIGSIVQEWSCCPTTFAIKNQFSVTVLRILGRNCVCDGEDEFEVVDTLTNENVGKIAKQWSGLVRELFTDADIFTINFPMGLDVNIKAVLLGAIFFFDFMYF